MSPNQVVAYNVAKARAIRGWTQEQAAEELAPYLGARLSTASFSALERSAWNVNRVKQFSADEMFALARGFDLPPASSAGFRDTAGDPHERAIDSVAAAGITTGYGDGTYRPREAVPRGQMATFLARALGIAT